METSILSGVPIKDEDTALTPETLVPFEDNKESFMSEINLEPIQQLQELDNESDQVSIISSTF